MSRRWPYPGLKSRVFLDYPLDILLNRQCSLKAHEAGLVPLLRAFEEATEAWEAEAEAEHKAEAKDDRLRALTVVAPTIASRDWAYWASGVRNWQALAGEPDVTKWTGMFHDTTVGKAFEKELNVASRSTSASPVEKRILGLHLLLQGRAIGSLQLPDSEPRGDRGEAVSVAWSGNIVIEGNAGSGKSTLALQLALAFTHWPNCYHAAYLALEEKETDLCAKARDLSTDWFANLRTVAFHTDAAEDTSPSSIGQQLYSLLTQPSKCPLRGGLLRDCSQQHLDHVAPQPMVLLPGLSPRSVVRQTSDEHALFWERFRQIERLLIGAKWLRSESING